MKKYQTIVAGILLFALAGCGATEIAPTFTQVTEGVGTTEIVNTTPLTEVDSNLFSDRDLAGDYDAASAAAIILKEDTAQITGSGASAAGTTVTVFEEGVYLISGNLSNGQIVIDAEKSAKVQLVLNGVNITSQTSAAIYSKQADKVFITLVDGTVNTLTNGGSYTPIDENRIDSVIFSKTDLTMNGSGALNITAAAGHGIVSKDELTIGNGVYQITASEHGLTGKDSIAIAAGTIKIVAGEDGIHVKNEENGAAGNLFIVGGDFDIESGGDGASATGTLQINDGNIRITTGGGSGAVIMKAGDSRTGRKQVGAGGDIAQSKTAAGNVSTKGLKADGNMIVNGGTFHLDTADDAVHSGADMLIAGGDWEISTGDDSIHADKTATIQNGTFNIPYCYEGIEGQSVTVDGGYFDIISADDGINAAGGMDRSGGMRASGGDGNAIVINGGILRIVSDGDSLDSNGAITLNGGNLELTCNGNGNTAVDCDGNYTNNGANITTNDGSENGGSFGMDRGGRNGGFGGMMNGQRPERTPDSHGGKRGFRGDIPQETTDGQQPTADRESPATNA